MPEHALEIGRVTSLTDEAREILHEYYEAVHVVKRDTLEALDEMLNDPHSGFWIARLNGDIVGCAALRKLPSIPNASECKRLYVRPSARGHGIADQLLDAQEHYARSVGVEWIYLDSYDDLKAAIALYRKRGYTECDRYNDNPQATIFLRKNIVRRELVS